jgi:mono/diheme cytochrome c family protein
MASAFLVAIGSTSRAAIPTGREGFKIQVAPFFKENCIKCHGPEKSKGKVTIHDLDGEMAAGHESERWEKILRMIKNGEMPPEQEKQPGDAERKAVTKWIEEALRNYAKNAQTEAAVPTARRLTNFEYQNTMRDILGFELKFITSLPEDPVKPYHFNNTAEFMLIGPEQMERYLECGRRAMASAIVDPGDPKVHRTAKTLALGKKAGGKVGELGVELGVYSGFGNHQALGLKDWPKTGEFKIRVKASPILPSSDKEVPLRLVMGTSLRHDAGTGVYAPVGTIYLRNDPGQAREFEFRGRIENIPFEPGSATKKGQQPPQIHIFCQNLFNNGELNDHRKSAFDVSWEREVPRILLESIEFEAPVPDVWPPEHHTRILFDSPLRKTDPNAYIREVLKRFMSRTYRRPVMTDELDRFVKIYNALAADFGTLEEAMRETLAMVLISPQFLYHTVAENGVATRQYELASKLSYFLWGSMPDDILVALAAQGRLDDPAVIAEQVRRLLADKRSGDFVNNFTTQWLGLAKMKTVSINRDLFPRFLYLVHVGERKDQEVLFLPTIRDYMHDETVGFVAELIKRNVSVLDIVDSDFAFLNQPLAAHYGVPGVQGNELRAVPIKPEHRLGGLLTQGSILIGNSTGSAPHPIYRAVWLREAILGEEVRPPPAEVPALSDSAGDAAAKAITIKDLLRQHRKQESCNVCHASLDPWGIPFEKYNAVGKFQPVVPKAGTRVRGFNEKSDKDLAGYETYLKTINTVQVEADAQVPRGPKIDGMEELKAYLLKERKDDIAANVTKRLLSYAIGRGLNYRDQSAVAELCDQTMKNHYRFQDVIAAICQSETFRGRR